MTQVVGTRLVLPSGDTDLGIGGQLRESGACHGHLEIQHRSPHGSFASSIHLFPHFP